MLRFQAKYLLNIVMSYKNEKLEKSDFETKLLFILI